MVVAGKDLCGRSRLPEALFCTRLSSLRSLSPLPSLNTVPPPSSSSEPPNSSLCSFTTTNLRSQAGASQERVPRRRAMKAFLHRINRGLSKEKDRDKESVHREKIPSLPPLRGWPPQHLAATPTSVFSYKPLPEISSRPLPPISDEHTSSSTESSASPTPAGSVVPLPPQPEIKEDAPHSELQAPPTSPPAVDAEAAGRNSRKTNNSNGSSSAAHTDVQKKVAFISPPPTPGPALDQALPTNETPTPATSGAPLKTTVSRFQAAQQPKDSRGSTSTAASSKTDVVATVKPVTAASTRTVTSPYSRTYGDGASIHQSLRSGTPFSQLTQESSRILSAQSWSEGAEEDLVSNIGQRERTRQEVLWEIVASEER